MMKSVSPLPPVSFSSSSLDPPKPTFNSRYLKDPTNTNLTLKDFEHINWTASEASAQEFLDCMVNFVTYNGCYIPHCFQLMVQGFKPKLASPDAEFDLELSDKISHLIHATLQKILILIPLSTPLLGNALKDEFPHKRFTSEELFVYLKNLLLVSYYATTLVEPILSTAIDRLIQIDVDINLEDIPEENDDLQFEVELEPGAAELTARKLDSMMIVVFEYLDAAFGTSDGEDHQHAFPPMALSQPHKEQLFTILLQLFDKYILTTYKSKYTQFLLFYVCRLKPELDNSYSARFMAYLYNKIQHKAPRSNQMASAAYLGSFLARTNYVPASTLREVTTFILNWALSYLNSHPNASPDAVVHGLFYSMSQSLYYIFCFRHKVLLAEGNTDALKKGYKRITESKFNPLKFCLPTIVREFARIGNEISWFDYSDLIARNEKLVLATKSSFGGANQLEMFFPFDPYLLKHSSKYLDPYYVTWAAPEDEEEDDEDEEERHAFADDSSDDSSDDGDEDQEEEEGRQSDDIDQLTQDFMHFTPDVERDITYHFSFD